VTSTGSWIAASVRARSLALGRLGVGGIHSVLMSPDRSSGLSIAAASMYSGAATDDESDPGALEHQIGAAVLWRLRVLAGWVPPGGSPVLRCVAAYFERQNILRHAVALSQGQPRPDEKGDYVLGGLATCWPAASRARNEAELRSALAASPWGDPVTTDPVELADTLSLAAWRRLVVVAPAARRWARDAVVLLAARLRVIENALPSDRQLALATPLIGRAWPSASDLGALRASLAPSGRRALEGVTGPDELWLAEAALVARIDADAVRMLRSDRSGPEVVLAAAAALMVDGWRLRAALTAVGDPNSVAEVLRVVA
jgi:hypothetical protein